MAWSRMVGGTQNRLFRLDSLEGPPLLAKLYVVDRWPRLESEFATLRALNAQHLARVPRALLRDDGLSYAIYSFEPGERIFELPRIGRGTARKVFLDVSEQSNRAR